MISHNGTFSITGIQATRETSTHLRLNKLSHTIYRKSQFLILGMSGYMMKIFRKKIVELFANSGDPDQTPRFAASDLGLHCLPVTHLGVSSLQWVSREVSKR